MYQPKTDNQLRDIAWGLYTGCVWKTIPEDSKSFAVPLAFGPPIDCTVGIYYEHMGKCTRWIGQYPMFDSVQWLDEADACIVNRYVAWLQDFRDSFLSSSCGSWTVPTLDRDMELITGPWHSSALPVGRFTPER